MPKSSRNIVVGSKVGLNLAELADDKNKFRRWHVKLMNSLTHVEKSYGRALERIKACIDAGGDGEEDVRIEVPSSGLPTPT